MAEKLTFRRFTTAQMPPVYRTLPYYGTVLLFFLPVLLPNVRSSTNNRTCTLIKCTLPNRTMRRRAQEPASLPSWILRARACQISLVRTSIARVSGCLWTILYPSSRAAQLCGMVSCSLISNLLKDGLRQRMSSTKSNLGEDKRLYHGIQNETTRFTEIVEIWYNPLHLFLFLRVKRVQGLDHFLSFMSNQLTMRGFGRRFVSSDGYKAACTFYKTAYP